MRKPDLALFKPINVIMLTVLIDMTGFGIIIPLIPFYAQRFASGPAGIGFLLSSFSIMQFLSSPYLGKVSDVKGRKPILLFSIFTSMASFFFFTFANSYIVLLLSRVVAGLASEGAVAQAYIADITTKEDRSSGLGKVGAAVGVGFILGPVIGGFVSPYGLRAPGAVALMLSLANLLFVIIFLPEPERRKSLKENEGFMQSLRGILSAIREPLTGQVYIIYFIVTLAFAAIPVIVPLLTIDYFSFTEVEMSYVFVFIGIIQVILQGFAMKRMIRIFGEETLIVLGPLLLVAGIILTPMFRSISGFGLATILVAVGVGITNTAIPGFISLIAPSDRQGRYLGLMQSVGSVARIFGPIMGGSFSEISSIQSSFYVSGLLLLIPFLLGCRLFRICTLKGILEPLRARSRERDEVGPVPPF